MSLRIYHQQQLRAISEEITRYRKALEEIEEYHSGSKGVHPDIAFDSITEILAETLH